MRKAPCPSRPKQDTEPQPTTTGGRYRYYTDLPPRKQGGTFMNDIIIPAKYRRDLDNAEYQVNAAHALLENIIEPMILFIERRKHTIAQPLFRCVFM